MTKWLLILALSSLAAAHAADVDTWIKQLSDDEFSVREAASKELIKAGETARTALEKLVQETKEVEARSRAASILRVLNMGKDFAALTAAERDIAQLPFESKISEDGKSVWFNIYGHENDFICDYGNVRIVIENQPFRGSGSGNSSVGGNGSSSITIGSFSAQSASGVTNIDFRGIKWKIEGNIMKIAGEETGFGGGANHVIFLDSAGKFKKRVDMSQEKAGKK